MLTYVLVHGAWSGAHGESLSAITGGFLSAYAPR